MATYRLGWNYFPRLSAISSSITSEDIDRNQPFDYNGTITATYANGSTKTISKADCVFSGYNMSVAGTYTVTISYTEKGTTQTTSYTLIVNKIYETIFNGNRSVGWVYNGSQGEIQGAGEVTTVAIPERNTQQLRITWQYNEFGGYHYSRNPAWDDYPTPYSGYWHYGNDIHYIYEYVSGNWSNTSWYSAWKLTHQATLGNWDGEGGTDYTCVDELTLNLSANSWSPYAPILGNLNAEGTYTTLTSNGVSLVFNKNTGKFELIGVGVMSLNNYLTPTSTVATHFSVYSAPQALNLGLTIRKIEIMR